MPDDMGDGMGDAMGDGMGSGQSSGGGTPPTITSLSPPSAVMGAAALLLTIVGAGYDGSTTVTFGGHAAVIDEVSATTIEAIIRAAWLDTAGTITVTVTNLAGSASKTFTVTEFSPVGPLTAVTTPSPAVIRAGDTSPSFPVALADANGPVDISSATLTLHLRAAWNDINIPGGVVTATAGTAGAATVTLPSLAQEGYYYAYITDGRGNSYPDTGVGFPVIVAPAAV